jgi:hypothetical protein
MTTAKLAEWIRMIAEQEKRIRLSLPADKNKREAETFPQRPCQNNALLHALLDTARTSNKCRL